MRKELNPALFGDGASPRVFDQVPTENTHLQLEQKIAEMRVQVHSLSDHLAKVVSQINEFIKSSQHKFERMHASILQLENNDKALATDTAHKLTQVQSRLSERKTMDQKVHEMIDRHNSALKTYEVRLNQMQKLIAEREGQIMTAQSALNEARMEIARLKRL